MDTRFDCHFGRALRQVCLGLLIALAAGCNPRVPSLSGTGGALPPDFPVDYYRQAKAENSQVLPLDPARSLLVIKVRKGGTFARLGHDHVVASHDVRGYVAMDRGRADLYVRLDDLVVDEPALRAKAGFDSVVSPEAAEGTRRNMLEKVLDSSRYPFALIHVAGKPMDGAPLDVDLSLHGATRRYLVPVALQHSGRDWVISGTMTMRQTDFGIVPFSVLGGGLQVLDELEIEFQLLAEDAVGTDGR